MPLPTLRLSHLCALLAALSLSACSSKDGDGTCPAASSDALCGTPGTAIEKGIDVSYYQGTIDWPAVAASSDLTFAIARVSDGIDHPDAQFAANWSGIKSAGLVRGVYQFFRPGVDPIQQADLVISALQANGGLRADDLPVVMDMEWYKDTNGNVMDASVIQANMRTWLHRIEAQTGRRPMIYTAAYVQSYVGTGFKDYALWVANYTSAACPTLPSGWDRWTFWQVNATGSYPPIVGEVDSDEFNGSMSDLADFIAHGPPDAGPPEPSCPVGNGYYCGGGSVGGDARYLYTCKDGVTTLSEACADGCQSMPVGVADRCYAPKPDGGSTAPNDGGSSAPTDAGSGDPADAGSGQTMGSGRPEGC